MTTEPRHASAQPAGLQRIGLGVALVALAAWGVAYLSRTALLVDGERVFLLWDGAMVSMQYARSWASGTGLGFAVGEEAVQGFANPLVTAAMALVHGVAGDPVRATGWLQLGLLLLSVAAAFDWVGRVRPAHSGAALGAAVAVGLSGAYAVWALQGSDVVWVGLWTLGLAGFAAREAAEPASRGRALLVLLALGPWIRWDAAVLALAFALGRAAASDAPARRAAEGAGVVLVSVAALALVSALAFGEALPNGLALHALGLPALARAEMGWQRLTDALPWLAAPLLLSALAVVLAVPARPSLAGAVALCVAALGMEIAIGGTGGGEAATHGTRGLVALLPLLLGMAILGLAALLARLGLGRFGGVALLGVGVLLGTLASPSEAVREWLDPGASTLGRDANANAHRLARYVASHTEPGTTIAVAESAGVLAYVSERPAFDLYGRHDRHVAGLSSDRFAPGRSKWDWEHVIGTLQPDLLLTDAEALVETESARTAYKRVRAASRHRLYVRADVTEKLADPSALFVAISRNPYARKLTAELEERAGSADDWGILGRRHQRAGEMEAAIFAYREALLQRPNWPALSNELAWLLVTTEASDPARIDEAVAIAERAAATFDATDPNYLDTLATVYAAAGRFDEAVETAERAIGRAAESGNVDVAAGIAERLALFRAGRPYRPR